MDLPLDFQLPEQAGGSATWAVEDGTPCTDPERLGEEFRLDLVLLCRFFCGLVALRHPVVLLYTCFLRYRRNMVIKLCTANCARHPQAPAATEQPNRGDPPGFLWICPKTTFKQRVLQALVTPPVLQLCLFLQPSIHREGPVVGMQTPRVVIFACSLCHNAIGNCSARASVVK